MAGNPYRETVPGLDLADVQGNILRGYHRMEHVRHLVARVTDPVAARAVLGACTDGSAPAQVTSATRWQGDRTPDDCLNVGITFAGLSALGVPAPSLAGFPAEFREGMVARSDRLGDTGPSAPRRWDTALGDPRRVHLVLTIHARRPAGLDLRSRDLLAAGGLAEVDRFDGTAFPGGVVHFGYRDGIAQPRFRGVHDPEEFPDRQPLVPLGAVLLGHPTPFPGLRWRVPQPAALGHNGAFNAFRVLAQDVPGFERFVEAAAKEHPYLTEEMVAAKLCGRYRNGVPLQHSPAEAPEDPKPDDRTLDDFDYDADPAGRVCPLGAHIRRANPRSAAIVQRGTNHHRQIVRRGMPYGPLAPQDPGEPRGLLGNFICASLAAQFESVQGDWLNRGLHEPNLTGTNDGLTGTNDPASSRFEIPVDGGRTVVLSGFESFVTTRGGAYTFLPSLTALRWIARLPGPGRR